MFNRMKLMPKMITFFLLIGLLPMLITVVLSLVLADQALTEEVVAQVSLFHGQQQTILTNWFGSQRDVAAMVAGTRDVYESLNYYYDDQSMAGWNSDELRTPFLWETRNKEVLTPFLQKLVSQYGFQFSTVINREGTVISASDSKRLNDNLSGQGYFEKALRGQTNISEIFHSEIMNQNCMVLATPIYSNGTSGTVNGVINFFLNVAQISEMLTGELELIGKTADAYLVDAKQTLLTVPRFSQGMEVLKTRINTVAAEEAARAVSARDLNFQRVFVYQDMQGNKVIGNTSTFTLGEQTVGFNIKVDYDEAFGVVGQLQQFAIFLAIAISVVVALIGVFFARSIIKPFLGINEKLKLVAAGDFTVKFATARQDEIGEMANELNVTVHDLRDSLTTVVGSAESVQTASSQIASGNQDLSQRTQEQASSLEEISATMEEVNASIQQVAVDTDQANQVAQITLEAVNEGDQSIIETIDAMEEISNSSKQIAEIIQVVNDIAFQTNLLALNAAVEAARAGEQGRGFAVVAAEVRNLAGRTAESAKEIEDLIGESVRRVDRGNIMIKKSDDMLKRIVENTKKTSDVIVEVASAMREQSSAAEQIQSSIEQLNQVTQENAAMVEEISATSEELDAEAESLLDNVAQFKVAEQETFGRKKEEPKSFHGKFKKGAAAQKYGLAKGDRAENFKQDSLDRF